MCEEFLTKNESLMVVLAYLAYADATIPIWSKTPWKIFNDLNRTLDKIQPQQKMVWGPAIGVSWVRSIVGFPLATEYFTRVLSVPNALVTDLVRSNMFPSLSPVLKSFRKQILDSSIFKGLVSVTGSFAEPLMNMGVFTDAIVQSASFFSRSFMYIVEGRTSLQDETHQSDCTEYTVAIRGSNPYSIASFFNAVDISKQVIWDHDRMRGGFPDIVSADEHLPCISRGAYHALNGYLNMIPRAGFYSAGIPIVDFFKERINKSGDKKVRINLTGHSLGGILVPSLALWLYEEFKKAGWKDKVEFRVYTFASPTPGNRTFAEHIDRIFGDSCRRYENELDPVTHQYNEDAIEQLPHLYEFAGIKPDPITVEYINVIKQLARNKGYTHLKNRKVIPSAINKDSLEDCASQGIYQHIYPYINAVARAMEGKEGQTERMKGLLTDLYSIISALYDSYATFYPFI